MSIRPAVWRLACLFAMLVFTSTAWAQAVLPPDARGGKDHPLMGRYEGSRMTGYLQQEFANKSLLNRTLERATNYKLAPANTTQRAGRYTHIAYEAPIGRSSLEVFQNQISRLTSQGFRIVFSCEEATCVDDPKQVRYLALAWSETGEHRTGADRKIRYALLEQDQAGALNTVAIRTAEHGAPNTGPCSVVSVVEAKPMQTGKIVFVDASAMQSAIASSGRVALYGILFDTDKADIKAESKATLEEIAKFRRANLSLNLVVAGHTDSQGGFDYNVGLSQRRAAAVVAALAGQHGIPAKRMTAFGAGMAAPVASNDDEAGRSKNRRVELVKR